MCGRYTLGTDEEALIEAFDVPEQPVGTVFLGRVEVDQTLSRADQQFDVVEGVLRHLESS